MSSTLNSTAHFHIWVINILQKYSRVSSDYPRVLSWFHNSHIFLLWNAHPCWFSPLPLFSSVAQLCLTLWDPMNCSTPGFPVHHQLLEPTQTHVRRVSDAIQLSYPLSSSSPPVFNPSIRVFSNESVLCIRWPKYWSFSFNISPSNEHPGLISFRIDWLDLQSFIKYVFQRCFLSL